MKNRLFYALFALVVVSSMILAGCVTKTETPAPGVVPTEVPQPTEPPVAVFEPMKVEAPNCDYGGEFKSIEDIGNWEMPGFYIGDGGWRAASTTTVNSFTS